MGLTDPVKSALIGTSGGLANTGLQYLFTQLDKEDEKQWWYEQQKYLEEHNSPAYRSMKMKQAGLNPYTELSSVPLGNVDSSLPRMSAPRTFDVSAIQNSLLLDAERENIEQDTKTKASVEGLNREKMETESEWRSNIIQQTLNLRQEFELGLITKDEADTRLQEYKEALSQGYNSYLIEWDLKESNKLLNDSLSDLNAKQGEKVEKETLLTSVKYASATLELILDSLYSEMERKAELQNVSLHNAFTKAELDEFFENKEVRQSLFNVQLAFAEFAVNEGMRHEALATITNEHDKKLAEMLLKAVEDGKPLSHFATELIYNDSAAFFSGMSNILSQFAPNIHYSRSSSTVIRKNEK